MKKSLSFLLLTLLFSCSVFSQTSVSVDLQKNSWLAIRGTTNIISFRLVHNGEKLLGKTINITTTQKQNKLYTSQNQLSIAVKNFKSENAMALRDFLKLIKSDSYPNLLVQLNYVETLPGNEKNRYTRGNAFVNITITGVMKQYHIPVCSNQHGEYVTVDGGKKINIQDFGLEPPVEMLGLIKVSEWINIDFHMVCKLTIGKDTQNKSTLALN
ncbi:MAG TPA: YceI family protein [Paludibacter sp.]